MQPPELKIIYEDKQLLAINKPQGLVTEYEPHLNFTLESLALNYIRSQGKYPQKCFIGVPHRLDRPVSGVVLLSKKKSVLKMLMEIFAKREIEKTYLAIVTNKPPKQEDELINWLVKDTEQRKAIIYNTEVKNAMRVVLQYKLIAENKNGSLLQIKLITGKFHQIRAQLAHMGCPIIGDARYGSTLLFKENAICLHARQLDLTHPVSNEPLSLIAELPDDEIWQSFAQVV